MKAAVVGGTGEVGRHVVDLLDAAGHDSVVLSRSVGVDVTTGNGLDDAVAGAQILIDVGNVKTISRTTSEKFFRAATTNLIEAGAKAGVAHFVVLSIVGCDRVDQGYYFGKRVQEAIARDGRLPATVLRATQFHEFPQQLIDRSPGGPFLAVPRMRSQTVAAREVAEALVEIALGEPMGMAGDMAGPEVHEMPDLVRLVLRARGSRRAVIPIRVPGAAGKAMTGGGLLPDGEHRQGRQSFAEWLALQTR